MLGGSGLRFEAQGLRCILDKSTRYQAKAVAISAGKACIS